MKKSKLLLGTGLFCLSLAPAMLFAGCDKNKTVEIQPAVQWLSGTKAPYGLGNDGDYYIDTDDYLLYKKTNGVWNVVMNNFGAKGNTGTSGTTPTVEISADGYWVINGKKTETKAKAQDGVSVSIDRCEQTEENGTITYTIFFSDGTSTTLTVKNGVNGITPTIEINAFGNWEINGEDTSISAKGKDGKSVTVDGLTKTSQTETESVYTMSFSDGSSYNITIPHGEDGTSTEIEISENGFWVVNGEETTNVAVIKVVNCSLVNSNGNVDIYEILFNNGDKASFTVKNGVNPTIEINDQGTWVINGEETEWSTIVNHKDLANKLSSVIEIDSSKFEPTYEAITSYYTYEQNTVWGYSNRDMYGYSGVIGNPSEISALRFKVRKAAKETSDIEKIIVELKAIYPIKDGETTSLVETVSTDELIVSYVDIMEEGATTYNEHEVIWDLDKVITNKDDCYYLFSYRCLDSDNKNVKVDMYGAVGGYSQIQVSSDVKAKYSNIHLQYYSGSWQDVSGKPIYLIPVQVGVAEPVFTFADKVMDDILNKIDIVKAQYTNDEIILPSTIYGHVGQNIEIYFNNISAYTTDEVYFKIGGSKGKTYTSRWTYTPTEEETFELPISIYTKDYKLINSKTINVVINNTTTEKESTVLVIGDSTVAGGKEIEKMLELANTDNSKELTFIGTKGDGEVLHEGRSGWKLREYLGEGRETDKNPFYNTETGELDFANYMSSNSFTDLDVVFIQAGINDIFSVTLSDIEEAAQTYTQNLQTLINAIHAYNPNVKIILNTMFPCCPDQDKFGEKYGYYTVWEYHKKVYTINLAIINELSNINNVYVSSFNAAIDVEANVPNDVHPSNDGYAQLGTQMYYYLKSLLAIE